jgi:hypothetical protein
MADDSEQEVVVSQQPSAATTEQTDQKENTPIHHEDPACLTTSHDIGPQGRVIEPMCDHCRKLSIAYVKDENTNACDACVKNS